MAAAYLWINAVLYALLALWCTVLPTRTSQAIGFIELSSSGRSEYAVIYGGMQFGFAFLFAWAALSGNHRFGLIFSLAIYVPILLFRIVSVAALLAGFGDHAGHRRARSRADRGRASCSGCGSTRWTERMR